MSEFNVTGTDVNYQRSADLFGGSAGTNTAGGSDYYGGVRAPANLASSGRSASNLGSQVDDKAGGYSFNKLSDANRTGSGGGGGGADYMSGIAKIGSAINDTAGWIMQLMQKGDIDKGNYATLQTLQQQLQAAQKMLPLQVSMSHANLKAANMQNTQSNTMFQNAQQDRSTAMRRNASFIKGIAKGLQNAQAKRGLA